MNVRQIAARVEHGQDVRQRGSPQHVPPKEHQAGSTFAEELRRAHEGAQAPAVVKLSAHAEKRIAQRGISFDEADRQSMSRAMGELETKGARDALLLRADAAFVVNVPSRTVVTAVGQSDLKARAFTQIDSAMLL